MLYSFKSRKTNTKNKKDKKDKKGVKDIKSMKDIQRNGLFLLPFFIPNALFVPHVLFVLFWFLNSGINDKVDFDRGKPCLR